MSKLKPYPEYKDSGSTCFGAIPRHWSVAPLGQHFTERRETASDKDFAPLSVTKDGIVPQLSTAAKTDNGENRKRVCSGDFVINSRSDRKGSAGLSSLDGSVSVISTVLTPTDLNGRFVHHQLRSVPFQEEYFRFGSGIVADLWSTRYSSMKGIKLPVPPLEEQAAIAQFLDVAIPELEQFIVDQEKLIELLKERRSATITQAVTRGLNPDVPLKNSGVQWLGKIPTKWLSARIKHARPTQESGTSVNAIDLPAGKEEIGVLKTSAVSSGFYRPEQNKTVPEEEAGRVRCAVRPGSLLVNRANSPELVGTAVRIRNTPNNLFLSDKLWQIQFSYADSRFVAWWASTAVYRSQIGGLVVGASQSMQNLSYEAFRNLYIAMPDLTEQIAIADYLDRETAEIDAAIADAQQAIALSKERRAALISAAVTGKIDVRDAVVRDRELAEAHAQ